MSWLSPILRFILRRTELHSFLIRSGAGEVMFKGKEIGFHIHDPIRLMDYLLSREIRKKRDLRKVVRFVKRLGYVVRIHYKDFCIEL